MKLNATLIIGSASIIGTVTLRTLALPIAVQSGADAAASNDSLSLPRWRRMDNVNNQTVTPSSPSRIFAVEPDDAPSAVAFLNKRDLWGALSAKFTEFIFPGHPEKVFKGVVGRSLRRMIDKSLNGGRVGHPYTRPPLPLSSAIGTAKRPALGTASQPARLPAPPPVKPVSAPGAGIPRLKAGNKPDRLSISYTPFFEALYAPARRIAQAQSRARPYQPSRLGGQPQPLRVTAS